MGIAGLRQRALVRTASYLRPHVRQVAVIVVSSIVSTAAYVSVPLIVKTVVDGPLRDGDRAAILRWSAIVASLALLELVLAFVRRTLLAMVATRLETRLRTKLQEFFHFRPSV